MEVILAKKPKIIMYFTENHKQYYIPDVLSNMIVSYIGIWTFISESTDLNYRDLKKYKKYIDWESYSEGHNKLTYNIVENFSKKISWPKRYEKWINEEEKITDNIVHFIKKSVDGLWSTDLTNISNNNKEWFYSQMFIDAFPMYIDWSWVSKNIKLENVYLDRYFKYLYKYRDTYCYQDLSDLTFLENHRDDINWTLFSTYQNLTDNCMQYFINDLDWPVIFDKHILNDHILDSLPQRIINSNISIICKKQNINKSFIINNINIVEPRKILENPNIKNNIKQLLSKNCILEEFYFKYNDQHIVLGTF